MAPQRKDKKRVQHANVARSASAAARKEKEPPTTALEAVKACQKRKFRPLINKELNGRDCYDPGPMYGVLSRHYFAGLLPGLPEGVQYGSKRKFDELEAAGYGMVGGLTHFEDSQPMYILVNPVCGLPEATKELDEIVVHEGGVHVTNGVDGTWTKKDDHGKCFADVASVLSEKTGVAIAVELTEDAAEKLRKLAMELPDEPDWEHPQWMDYFEQLRKSNKRRKVKGGGSSWMKRAKAWVFRMCCVSSAGHETSTLASTDAESEATDETYHPSSSSDVSAPSKPRRTTKPTRKHR